MKDLKPSEKREILKAAIVIPACILAFFIFIFLLTFLPFDPYGTVITLLLILIVWQFLKIDSLKTRLKYYELFGDDFSSDKGIREDSKS